MTTTGITTPSRLTRLPTIARAAGTAGASMVRRRNFVPGGVVLAYHDILADDVAPFEYAVSVRRFRQQLDVVDRMRLAVISLREMSQRFLDGQELTGRVAIVFDDALVGVHHLALPELAGRGWTATVLPVVDQMGRDPAWWPGSQRTMTWPELTEAIRNGVDIAAHGTTHSCLPCLRDQPLAEELGRARGKLTEVLGTEVDQFAYPYGHHDARVRDAVTAASYTTAYTFLNGRVMLGADSLLLPRLTMHQRLTAPLLAHQLSRLASDWPNFALDAFHPHPASDLR